MTFPIWQKKLANVLGYRGDLNVTLNINASPFHAGLFRLCFLPNQIATSGTFNRTNARQTLVTCPGQTFSLQDTTQVCLRVPYLNSQPYILLKSSGASFDAPGQVLLIGLTGLTLPAGVPAPTFSMYAHFTNVSLVGPKPETWSSVQPQGLFEDLQSNKAISTTLATGAKLLSYAGSYPMIPKSVSNAGWLMRIASNAASRLGFSKPAVNAPTTRIQPSNGVFRGQATGADYATNLSIFSDSAVPLAAPAGTDVDESSVAYVASVPGLINEFTLSSTMVAGTLVYACALSPSSLFFQPNNVNLPLKEYRTAVKDGIKAIYASPAMCAAATAEFWRGNFKMIFRFSKTRFHMGRLAFVFVPGSHDNLFNTVKGLTGYSFPTYAEIGSLPRNIVDLRNVTETVIDCPFVSTSSMMTQQSHIGYLCVYVVDPVNAPATVTPEVPVLVEAAMSSLSLAVFSSPCLVPTNRNASTDVYAQSGFDGTVTNEATGEVIESLNLLTRRTVFRQLATSFFEPYRQNFPAYTPAAPPYTAADGFNTTLVDYVRAGFAYERGGMIVEVRPPNRELATFGQGAANRFLPTTVDVLDGNPRYYNYVSIDGNDVPVARTYVPRYTPNSIYRTNVGGYSSYNTWEPGAIADNVGFQTRSVAGEPNAENFVGLATADDHQFLLFIGWPAMIWPTDYNSPI